MRTLPILFFVALVLVPRTTFGCHNTDYPTGFVTNSGIKSSGGLRSCCRQHLHSVRHVCPASDDAMHNTSIRRHSPLFHAKSCHTPNIHARANTTMQQLVLKILSQFRTAALKLSPLMISLALMISLPMNSWASSRNPLQSSSLDTSSSSSYYLQNNPRYPSSSQRRKNAMSIQTQKSQPYSSDNDYKYVKRRDNRSIGSKKQTVKRMTLFVVLATFAASSYRASLRKKRVFRNTSPFGRIRNASPLGNGVSVIRVCMALGFDASDSGNGTSEGDDVNTVLKRLHLEEKELYTKIAMLAQHDQLQGDNTYDLRQKALGDYVSSVAATFLKHHNVMRYGSIDSVRIPFVEEAVREFRRAAGEERKLFDTQRKQHQSTSETPKKQLLPKTSSYMLATILLVIKGDHTSISLPFGIIRQRDMARALSRIVTDAAVEDCLVGSEVLWTPKTPMSGKGEGGSGTNHHHALTEKEIMKSFPDLVRLT